VTGSAPTVTNGASTNGATNSAPGSNASTASVDRNDNFKLIEELLEEQKKNSSSAPGSLPSATKFFKISGYIKIIFNDDKILYLSCPDCRKKVIPEDLLWRCENCNKLHENNLPTYMLSALISDVSGNVMVQFPRELGDSIMNGISAAEFLAKKENN
jgi:hypothetical protein